MTHELCGKCKNAEKDRCKIYESTLEEAVKACAGDGLKSCKRKGGRWDEGPLAIRYCKLFKCKRYKWIHICCTDCRKMDCKERCLNTPEKCRQVKRG